MRTLHFEVFNYIGTYLYGVTFPNSTYTSNMRERLHYELRSMLGVGTYLYKG